MGDVARVQVHMACTVPGCLRDTQWACGTSPMSLPDTQRAHGTSPLTCSFLEVGWAAALQGRIANKRPSQGSFEGRRGLSRATLRVLGGGPPWAV